MSRILIISDDHAFAVSLRVLLKRDRHSVMMAEDASSGLFRLFMDRPWFVVVHLRLETEVRKVCRHLLENVKIPFLIIGNPSLSNDPKLKPLVPHGNFQPLPASVHRIYSRITEILRQQPGPADTGSRGASGLEDGRKMRARGYNGRSQRHRSADRRCRTYERHSRMDAALDRRPPSLETWV